MGIYFPGTGTLACVVWPGAGITCSQAKPPNIFSGVIIIIIDIWL